MDKNLITAFALSTLVLMAYFFLFPPQSPEKKPPQTAQTQDTREGEKMSSTLQTHNPGMSINSGDEKEINHEDKQIRVETPLYEGSIRTTDAYLESLYLKDYEYVHDPKTPIYAFIWNFITGTKPKKEKFDPDRKVNMVSDVYPLKSKPLQFLTSDKDYNLGFTANDDLVQISNHPKTLEVRGQSSTGLDIVKEFTFFPDSYVIEVKVRVENRTDTDKPLQPTFRLGAGNENIEHEYNPLAKSGISLIDTSFETYDADDDNPILEDFKWAGVMSKYFVTGIISQDKKWKGRFTAVESKLGERTEEAPNLDLFQEPFILKQGSSWNADFKIFMGPKEQKEMEKFSPTFDEALDLFFDWLARPMLFGLRWFHSFTGNWGIAIMLLTLVVRVIMFPLALKGMKSMKRMQKLTPMMKKIKEKHGDNKEKLNREMMSLYKRNKINPVGGCLPILMQFPIFIALYWALLPAIEIRHQPFYLWLNDLSAMDHTLILPMLMGVTMFIQQQITPMSAAMDPMQQKIFRFFPIIMTFFFITFPSGLVLYWVTSNVITILQQLIFNKVQIKEVIE